MFKKILFATTISPDCDDAAIYAFDLAMKYNAVLYLFHVCGLPSHGYSQFIINLKTGQKEAYGEEYESIVLAEIRNRYADALDQYGKVQIQCTIGSPATEILRKLKKEEIDLVIMGAHHQAENDEAIRYRNVTGDTLQRVAKSARCPVLVISRPYSRNLWGLSHILCGTDLTKASMPAFRFALKFARENKACLHLFHALDLSSQGFGKGSAQADIERQIQAAKAKMQTTYGAELEGYDKVEMVVWEGIPYVEILKYAREKAVDLIAMSHHAGSIFQPKEQLGSTIEEVVLRSACPVVSVNRLNILEDYSVFQA